MKTFVLLLMVGCGPASVRGSIDGEPVGGARDAVWDDVSLELGPLGDLEYTAVVLTNWPRACEVLDDLSDVFEPSCEERCEEYLEIAAEYGLRDDRYWTLVLTVNTSEGEDGVFDFDRALGDEEFTADYQSYDGDDLWDQDSCEDACEDGDLLEAEIEAGEDGTLDMEERENDLLHGGFDVEFDGDGLLEGGFTARPCNMEDWWF